MKILLAQHGDAVPKEVDEDRPLSDKGRADVERVGATLRQGQVSVSRIIHSGKTRAEQTSDILASGLKYKGPIEVVQGLNPNDPVEKWGTTDWTDNTLVVGHLPFMGRLVSHLVAGNDATDVVEFRPGSVVCLQKHEASNWNMCWMLRPEILGHI